MEPPTVEGYSFDCASIADIVAKAVAQDEAKAGKSSTISICFLFFSIRWSLA